MKEIDIRLNETEMAQLNNLCGATIKSIYHDPFTLTNTSLQIVKMSFDNGDYFLYSFTEPLDYYGSTEDVAVWTFKNKEYPAVSKKIFIEAPINEIVHQIHVVQENQKLFENGNQTYDVWLTRGLIFDFGDYQFSFEKTVWFSEDIIIRKGYNLINEFNSTDSFTDKNNWAPGITAYCTRKVLSLPK